MELDPLPDLSGLSDDQLKHMIEDLKDAEREVSMQRRLLHGRMDILKQVKAVQKALEQVSTLTLENHLNTCVATAIRSQDETEQHRVVNEIMDVFRATVKM